MKAMVEFFEREGKRLRLDGQIKKVEADIRELEDNAAGFIYPDTPEGQRLADLEATLAGLNTEHDAL